MAPVIRWCTVVLFFVGSLATTPAVAQTHGGGGSGGGGGGGASGETHQGDIFGDLIHIKRDPITGQPILQKRWISYPSDVYGWGYCPIPIDAKGDEIPFAPLSCDVDPAYVDATVPLDYFGRLSGGRTRARNIRMHFDEVIGKINDAQLVDRDTAGRLRMATECTQTTDGTLDRSTCVWTTVDSPQENLAVYNRLMRYGHLQTDPFEIDLDFQGDPTTGIVYHPALTAADYRKFQGVMTALLPVAPSRASSCFGASAFTCDDPQPLTSDDFGIAVSMLAGAADKTGIVTPDLVQYLNRILGITTSSVYALANINTVPALIRDCGDDTSNVIVSTLACTISAAPTGLPAPADERFVNFSVMQYDRSVWFGGTADVIKPTGTGTWGLQAGQAISPFLAFKNPGHETGANLHGFINAGNDALRAVEFLHNYEIPADLGWDFATIVPDPAPIALTSLTSDLPSPQVVGTRITFTATATGGVAPLQYKWWVKVNGVWNLAQTWSESNTFAWAPSTGSDTYAIGVWVRHADSVADATLDTPEDAAFTSMPYAIVSLPPIRILTITPNLPAPQIVNTTVTFTGSAEGGIAPYQYKWWVFDGMTWAVAADWNASGTFQWKPGVANAAFRVGAWVRSAGSSLDTPEGTSSYMSIPYPIDAQAAVRVTSLTPNMPAPQPVNTTVTFTATASGGATPYQYRYYVFDGTTWSIVRDYSTDATYSWTPVAVNVAYRVGVWIRSSGNTDDVNPESLTAYMSVPFAITTDGALFTNNLSVPVVFAEGIGLTGLPSTSDTGLRPTAAESSGVSTVFVASTPSKFVSAEAYTKDAVTYFPQQTSSTWQADWRDGRPDGEHVVVNWSDNLLRGNLSADSPVHVETTLYEKAPPELMQAYTMAYLFGSGRDEMWGTDSTTFASPYRTVFAATARLTIERITGPGADVVSGAPRFDASVAQGFAAGVPGPFAASVNVAGDLSYAYDWMLNEWPGTAAEKTGWWRLTFRLEPSATYTLTASDGRRTSHHVTRNAMFESPDPADVPDGVRFRPHLVDPYTSVVEVRIGAPGAR